MKFLHSILAQLSFKFRSSNSSVYNCSDHAAIHAGNNTDFVQIKPTIIWNLIGMKLKLWISQILWLNFFCPILEHFCPLFVQIAQMGLILPRWGLILPRIPPPMPVLYSAVTNPFLGYVLTRNTPSPTPKHPFSSPELESGQNELPSGQNGPHLCKMFEKWAKLF